MYHYRREKLMCTRVPASFPFCNSFLMSYLTVCGNELIARQIYLQLRWGALSLVPVLFQSDKRREVRAMYMYTTCISILHLRIHGTVFLHLLRPRIHVERPSWFHFDLPIQPWYWSESWCSCQVAKTFTGRKVFVDP